MEDKKHAQEVTERIIEQLRQGTAPWQKPWKPGEMHLPYNAASGKEYKGINSLWLQAQGHDDPRWMTYKQAKEAGAQVRWNSKGTRVTYWKFEEERTVKDADGRPVLDENGKPKKTTVPLEHPQRFSATVFNAEQIDGLPQLKPKQVSPEPERHARAEKILINSGANIKHVSGDRAFYQPSTDSITMPKRNQFPDAGAYYSTALHELGHWTGHGSRMGRDLAHPFGSEGYAREELRAEIASLMLGERLEAGYNPSASASYVASWIKVLENDHNEIFKAARDAEIISRHVMALEHEQAQEHVWTASKDKNKEASRETVQAPEAVFTQNNEPKIPVAPDVAQERAEPVRTEEITEAGKDKKKEAAKDTVLDTEREPRKPVFLSERALAAQAAKNQPQKLTVSVSSPWLDPVNGIKAGDLVRFTSTKQHVENGFPSVIEGIVTFATTDSYGKAIYGVQTDKPCSWDSRLKDEWRIYPSKRTGSIEKILSKEKDAVAAELVQPSGYLEKTEREKDAVMSRAYDSAIKQYVKHGGDEKSARRELDDIIMVFAEKNMPAALVYKGFATQATADKLAAGLLGIEYQQPVKQAEPSKQKTRITDINKSHGSSLEL